MSSLTMVMPQVSTPFRTIDLHSRLVDGEFALLRGLGSSQRTREVELVVDALDTVSRVDVLDQSDLEASGGALAGDDGRVREEVLPDL